ncbi:zinc finger BED domain-containing protein RICESLEEPER 2 [Prunus yedoensis var. nudiflora]|uniref:Zinc finger BED domain-containing protein RICESLEEPER 2 n=1 Tax=Prunus yedoensis var. nudiflora TaxID=2094558 RepID=A0A314XYM8_PRUYE|nr:zinc finger BED domain-containing protein RICESLEEPER 2 [Prunus yedoensis var. nudiflora]
MSIPARRATASLYQNLYHYSLFNLKMAQDVDHSPQVPNEVPDQVPEQATIRGNPKKRKITKKSGFAGNHGKSEVGIFVISAIVLRNMMY